jgi:RNA polymerase sigma factor (sigma-70 family)
MSMMRSSLHQPAGPFLADLKKADEERRNEFVWLHQEKFYSIACLATGGQEKATDVVVDAFRNIFSELRTVNPKKMDMPVWDWLSEFVVEACEEYHRNFSPPVPMAPRTDPSADGSAQMDWETTIILGPQRVKRCLTGLPAEQRNVFLLRHHFQLSYDQIAVVVNQAPETVKAWLFRARVQVVKCLGRG